MLRYAVTIFLGAFLLFQVQPIIARFILPWFGGSPAVWTTCMLFFQLVLLVGYAYAHWLSHSLTQRKQVVVHIVLLVAACLTLPIIPRSSLKPMGSDEPIVKILLLLVSSVGLPYLILSATSPLLQAWFSLSRPGASPYRLYALSNAGSLLALLSYPFGVEPALSLHTQAVAWSIGFCFFALLCAHCALETRNLKAVRESGASPESRPTTAEARLPELPVLVLWLALPACGSLMLLAVTNQMCWDVAVVPFLWVLPLSLYLLSFIFCFENERWYYRPVFWPLLALSMVGMLWLLSQGVEAGIWTQVLGFSGGLFVCCMVCHGELARLKPSPRHLTSFYLMISAGGALGGAFVTLVAPHVFRTYLELHLGMWACCALAVSAFWVQYQPFMRWRTAVWAGLWVPGTLILLVLLAHALRKEAERTMKDSVCLLRNFYGVLRVAAYNEDNPDRFYHSLQNGRISHGNQFVSKAKRTKPTTYYGPKSGIGLTLLNYPRSSPLRVGVVGLGTGTIAAYGKKGDVYRFFEINPTVQMLATSTFTYLMDSEAKCEVVLGDARLSLERERSRSLDVLALDAFTGDAIPVHLLTREAVAVYLRCLKPEGVLAVHISNRYLDLEPVVLAIAEDAGLRTAVIDQHAGDEDDRNQIDSSTWILVTRNEKFLDREPVRKAIRKKNAELRRCLWTDDYSNLFRILK